MGKIKGRHSETLLQDEEQILVFFASQSSLENLKNYHSALHVKSQWSWLKNIF